MKLPTFVFATPRRVARLRSLLLILLLPLGSALSAATLHDAAKSGDLEQVQRLTVGGADVNARAVRDETPLTVAALAGNGEIVNYLLQRGANIGARNDSGMTALHAAAYAGHTDIVQLLIAKGSDVNDADNKFGVSPLHVAAEENRVETVQALLNSGADTNILEVNGYSALSRAGWRAHWDVVSAMLARGAECQPEDIVGEWLYQECSTRAQAN